MAREQLRQQQLGDRLVAKQQRLEAERREKDPERDKEALEAIDKKMKRLEEKMAKRDADVAFARDWDACWEEQRHVLARLDAEWASHQLRSRQKEQDRDRIRGLRRLRHELWLEQLTALDLEALDPAHWDAFTDRKHALDTLINSAAHSEAYRFLERDRDRDRERDRDRDRDWDWDTLADTHMDRERAHLLHLARKHRKHRLNPDSEPATCTPSEEQPLAGPTSATSVPIAIPVCSERAAGKRSQKSETFAAFTSHVPPTKGLGAGTNPLLADASSSHSREPSPRRRHHSEGTGSSPRTSQSYRSHDSTPYGSKSPDPRRSSVDSNWAATRYLDMHDPLEDSYLD